MEESGGARRVPDWETCCLSTIASTTTSGKQDHMDQATYIGVFNFIVNIHIYLCNLQAVWWTYKGLNLCKSFGMNFYFTIATAESEFSKLGVLFFKVKIFSSETVRNIQDFTLSF